MMSDLKTELTTDPLGWGYNGAGVFNAGPGPMTDEEAADVLNAIHPAPDTRTRNRTSMTGDEVFQSIESQAIWDGLTDNQRIEFLALCGRDIIDPFGSANEDLVISIFGDPSTTISNLGAARVENVTRGVELGLGFVRVGHVEFARAS